MNKPHASLLARALKKLRCEVRFYRHLLQHPETPRAAKWCLYLGLAYLLSPIDLIPDFIPGLGQLDDLIIVGGLILVAKWLTPNAIIAACAESSKQEVS